MFATRSCRPLLTPLAVTVGLLGAATVGAQPAPTAQAITDRIAALVEPHAAAGLLSGVILVARDGETVFQRGYGAASWELPAPVDSSTRFGIGSITKVMTEAVVRQLVEAGRLSLDAPVASYLPGFPTGPAGGAPTVGHLLAHRAGVPHRVTTALDETQPLSAAAVVERVRAGGLLFEPGSRRLYSSAGYTCLARVIEVVEHRPFDDVLATRVFRPAGMRLALGETGQRLMRGRALPYRLGADAGRIVVAAAPYKDLRFLTGAGSVFATADDMERFVAALEHGMLGDELWEGSIEGADAWTGWYGRTSGYEASVDVLPGQHLVVVLLSNLLSASNWQIRAQLKRIATGSDAEAIPLPPPVVAEFEPAMPLLGTYGSDASPVEIALIDGKPFRGENEFYPTAGDRYYIPASGSTMRFRRAASGAVDAIVTTSGDGRESVMPRMAQP